MFSSPLPHLFIHLAHQLEHCHRYPDLSRRRANNSWLRLLGLGTAHRAMVALDMPGSSAHAKTYALTSLGVVTVLISLPVYALYSRSKFMGFFLFTFMLAETAIAAYLSFSRLHQHFPRVHYGVSLPVPPWLFAVDEGVCFHDVKKGIPMQAVFFGCVVVPCPSTFLSLRSPHHLLIPISQHRSDGRPGYDPRPNACAMYTRA